MIMLPGDALAALHGLPLQSLTNIPKLKGIYALVDHEHHFRYIGSTKGRDFHNRIHSRHTTGTEENSHKFSWAYNTGRMYRGPKGDDEELMRDRQAAKDLRTLFIRKHCRAVWMPLEGTRQEIEELEHSMVWLAPIETVQWNKQRVKSSPPPEPTELVDALIEELGIDPLTKARLERQAERYRVAIRKAAA